MSIKNSITRTLVKSPSYPCLKQHKHSGRVVLFTGPGVGTELLSETGKTTGDFADSWSEKHATWWGDWKPFEGELVLSNV